MSSFESNSPYERRSPAAPISLDELSPGSVMALFRHMSYMFRLQLKGDPAALDDHFDNLHSALGCALEELPKRNLPHARAVFQAFAESPVTNDREAVSFYIASLTREDHEFGLDLWQRLARDVESNVREVAVDIEVEADEEFAGVSPYLGITWHEGRWLIEAAERVDSGQAPPFDLAAMALHQVVTQAGTTPTDPA